MDSKKQKPGKASANRFEEANAREFLARLRADGSERQKAFRRLVELTHDPLMFYVRKFLGSPEEAQEVLQEVYLGVHKGLARFEGKSKLTTWIYGMAHNKVCDRLSDKFRRHEEYLDGMQSMDQAGTIAADLVRSTEWELSPDAAYLQKDLRDRIAAAVDRLPAQAREIYHLRDIEGLSGEEVAEILGISLTAVRVRLHRARNLIVQMVREMEKGSPAAHAAVEGRR